MLDPFKPSVVTVVLLLLLLLLLLVNQQYKRFDHYLQNLVILKHMHYEHDA